MAKNGAVSHWFTSLPAPRRALPGDRGAGALLKALPAAQYIAAPDHTLRDIDPPSDLP